MQSNIIRETFLRFFKEKGHHVGAHAPIVNQDDPQLLFINAGMNPFKPIFLGERRAAHPRIANSQPCLRVSGKHNDLEEVGLDTYHHTFFEMLGNWSFGDYFKKEAIAWAWELLTKVYGIPEERLYATFFAGDEKEGLGADEEAKRYWETFLPPDRIVQGGKRDNFWEMGATGPCGPCTELHVDLRSTEERRRSPGHLWVNRDHPQVVELWNVVFVHYNRAVDGKLTRLPVGHVDTGMGLERLAMVLQGKHSTYDTDLLAPLVQAVGRFAKVCYGGGHTASDVALRVIADHLRAVAFPIAEGLMPGKQRVGYVVRRILRRAVRYGYTHLGLRTPFLHRFVPLLAQGFDKAYPFLQERQDLLQEVIQQEETAFLHTLAGGLGRLAVLTKGLQKSSKTLDGAAAFELYDTYGFPLDLTALILREQGLRMDEDGTKRAMAAQRKRSKGANALVVEEWHVVHPQKEEDSAAFVGYAQLVLDTCLHKYRKVQKKGKSCYQLVLAQTPFYAEAGGQVGDRGQLWGGNKGIEVLDTQREHGVIVHYTEQLPEVLDAPLHAVVDAERRMGAACHHTATHLLQAALRALLGAHVAQRGSLVNEEMLRFDFTHGKALTLAQRQEVEQLVNGWIRANCCREVAITSLEVAKKEGAVALFGEKYGERVRVVRFGKCSVELCGGTHVARTGDIGFFKIVGESGVAAGVRRIEACTGKRAVAWAAEQERLVNDLHDLLPGHDLRMGVQRLVVAQKKAKKALVEASVQQQAQLLATLAGKVQSQECPPHYVGEVRGVTPDALKRLASGLAQQQVCVAVVATMVASKPYLAVAVSKALTDRYSAHAMVQALAATMGGRGGGQPFLAMAGGKKGSTLTGVLAQARALLKRG